MRRMKKRFIAILAVAAVSAVALLIIRKRNKKLRREIFA